MIIKTTISTDILFLLYGYKNRLRRNLHKEIDTNTFYFLSGKFALNNRRYNDVSNAIYTAIPLFIVQKQLTDLSK